MVTKEQTPPQVVYGRTYDSVLGKLSTSRISYATLRMMRRDPTISLARQLVVAPVLASHWSVEEEKSAPEGAKDFINEQMQPFRVHLLKTGMLGCIDYGWQSYEKLFELDGDTIVLRKLKPLLPDFTDILVDQKTGAFGGLQQETFQVTLAIEDSLLLNIDVEGTDWYGQGLLENAFSPYNEWNDANDAASRYDKKVAGSHWVVHYPLGTSIVDGVEKDNFLVAQTLIDSLEASGAVAVPRRISNIIDEFNKDAPDAWLIELITHPGAQVQFIARQKYLDALKVRALGLPERSILEGQFGTKAEAQAHADFAIINMELRHRVLCQHVNWHVVNQLLRLNYGEDTENTVYIEPAPIVDPALGYLRDLYLAFIGNESGFLQETAEIDWEAMKDRLGVPIEPMPDTDISDVDISEIVPDILEPGVD